MWMSCVRWLRTACGTARYPGVIDITDSFRSGKQELKLKMTPEGEALGLSLGALAQQVRQAFMAKKRSAFSEDETM